ncbi:Hypothetical protein R9X50_00788900 [Acrodontium crateriforme]|uniref:DUF726-domain-containing protein n=1 Tax=Acrodontium crateriforme TaxID=150365 RepID=A0AAQ3MDB7_9PEZI|nr:Hypothetical protein R9X50_00788900 [Acrodontium crateriforme]
MSAMLSKAASAFGARKKTAKDDQRTKQPMLHHDDEEEQSLTTILNAEDRSALTLLVADCTHNMRQTVLDTFDANQTVEGSDRVANLKGDGALASPDVDSASVNVVESDDTAKEREARQQELSELKMQELKTAALKYFDEWKANVLQRVGEIVNAKETNSAPSPGETSETVTTHPGASAPMRFPEPPEYDESVGKTITKLYPPIDNPLQRLDDDKRALIVHSILLLMLSLENYQAHSRTLMVHLTTSLNLPISVLAHDESKISRGLLTAAENLNAEQETKKAAEENQTGRRWKVGLATVAGAALIGVIGGLAAPLLAAGVGSVMGGLGLGATAAAGYLGSLAGSTMLVGSLFGAYGGRMTGKMMDQYAREVEDFGFVPVRTYHKPRKIEKEFRRLRVAIGISGWLTNKDEVVEPWRVIGIGEESFALRWELEALINLGNAMTSMVKSAAWGYAKTEIIKRTLFASLYAGLWPLALMKVSRVIDNPWSVANYRAQKAGEVLADALVNKAQGERPVTLIGYSLGAKVIYTCLHRLAERREFGLIESVVLIGSPTPSTAADWRLLRSVVTGRVVNVFSTKDYILAFLYRGSSIQYGVAGLQAIENVKGVENFDVSDIVTGHTSYRFLTGPILKMIGFEDVDSEELAKEEKQLKQEEEQEETDRAESEKKESAKETPSGTTASDKTCSDSGAPDVSDEHVNELEKEIQLKNEQSYIEWAQDKMTSAGTNAVVAYEKAKQQWTLRSQGQGGKTAAKAAGDAEKATGNVTGAAKSAGVHAPSAGDTAVQGMKADSQLRNTAS